MVGADTPLRTHLSEQKGWEVRRQGSGNNGGGEQGGQRRWRGDPTPSICHYQLRNDT